MFAADITVLGKSNNMIAMRKDPHNYKILKAAHPRRKISTVQKKWGIQLPY